MLTLSTDSQLTVTESTQVQRLYLIPGPLGFTQKFQRRFNRRIVVKAIDSDLLIQTLPTIVLLQTGKELFQRQAV
jgi:hypothetical protein